MPLPRPRSGARALGALAGAAIALGAPAVASAHGLSPTYQSPLPLAVYLVGAATTVALSFLFVLARDMRAAPTDPGHVVGVPGWLRFGLRAIGLIGWAWIMVQGIAGGSSDGAVAPLFLWIYGWVGVALISALIFPVWEWLDPFATLHDIGAWVLRRDRRARLGTVAAPGRPPPLAGRGRVRVLRVAGARRRPGRPHPHHRPRRVHGPHPRADGPVRPRHVAGERRDVHGLVPDPQPARGDRRGPGRRRGGGPGRRRRARPCSAGRSPPA